MILRPLLGLLGFALISVSSRCADAPTPVITIEDLLERESLSDVWISPGGDSVVFQIKPGAAHRRATEFFGSWLDGGGLFVTNLRTNQRHEIATPDADLSPSFLRLDPWSSDGNALLVTALASGHHHLAYWDRLNDKVHILPGRPASASLPDVKWLGRKLVYTSLADDARQEWSKSQRLDFLAKQWRQSWSQEGTPPTVTSANDLFATTEPSPGFLYVCDTRTAQTQVLARGNFGAISVSPTGRWLSVVRKANTIKDALADDGRRGELLIFDLSKSEPRLAATLSDLDAHPEEGVWSPREERLLFGAKRVGELRDAVRVYEWTAHAVTPISAALQVAMPFYGAAPRLMPYGWIGDQPAAIAGAAAKTFSAPEPGRWTYGRETNIRFDLYLLGLSGPKNMTAAAKDNVRQFVPDHQGTALAIVDGVLWRITSTDAHPIYAPEPGSRLTGFSPPGLSERYARDTRYHADDATERIAVRFAKNREPEKYAVIDLVHARLVFTSASEVVALSPDLLHAITRETDRWSECYVYDGQVTQPLAVVNQNLNSRAIAEVHPFTYQTAGARQKGWYVLPPHTDGTTRPLPAVVWIYGGHVETERKPALAATTGDLDTLSSAQLIAAQGYVVIYASYPLKPGQTSNLMADLANQAIGAIDQLAADHIVDPLRVAIVGHSFGGYSTAAVLTQRSDRFRAGIASSGIYDPVSIYGAVALGDLINPDGRLSASSINAAETGQLGLIDPPWSNPEAYLRSSPFFHVDKIDTPLLILQGDLEGAATSLEGAVRFYQALVRAGKKPTLLRYWGEGHGADFAATQRYRWNAVAEWLGHYLNASVHTP